MLHFSLPLYIFLQQAPPSPPKPTRTSAPKIAPKPTFITSHSPIPDDKNAPKKAPIVSDEASELVSSQSVSSKTRTVETVTVNS